MGLLSKLFGGGSSDIASFLEKGAVIIDVRSPAEFKGGHATKSINMPLDTIGNQIEKIKKMNKPVVVCCASGMRSGRAKGILESSGIECINGGPWGSVQSAINSKA